LGVGTEVGDGVFLPARVEGAGIGVVGAVGESADQGRVGEVEQFGEGFGGEGAQG